MVSPDIMLLGGDYRHDKLSVDNIVRMLGSLIGGHTPQVTSSESVEMKASDPVKFVPKGWGYEKWMANGPEYCGKLLFFVKGKKCSNYHEIKDEVFYIHSGAIGAVFGRDDDILKAEKQILIQGDKFHVPRGLRHQMFTEGHRVI